MRVVFIADFFKDQILGGGELNNEEFIDISTTLGTPIEKIQSHLVTPSVIENNKNSKFIVANFINLREDCKKLLEDYSYVIYEHDHKYLKSRNPAGYKNFKAPKDQIINYDFYKNAKAVLCQSTFHADIVRRNLDLSNILSLSGNLWSKQAIETFKKFLDKKKKDKCSIMDSPISHKNTRQTVLFCMHKDREYELVSSPDYTEFLDKLSNNKTFVFFPKTPETLSRVIVEARMMGMSVITNDLVGAIQEAWYTKKGTELIKEIERMREIIPKIVFEALND